MPRKPLRPAGWNKNAGLTLLCCLLGCTSGPAPSGSTPVADPATSGAPAVAARAPQREKADPPPAAAPRTWFAMQFRDGAVGAGSPASYFAHSSRLPKPAAHMVYGNVALWHTDGAGQVQRLRRMAQEMSHFGVKGLLYTPTANCASLKARIARGEVPPMDVMAKRYWTKDQPGFLAELEAQRDAIAQLVADGTVEFIILRPWQEAGAGHCLDCGFTPSSYRETIEWLVKTLYARLPVQAVISHWNRIDSIADTIPRFDEGIEVYAGVTLYMPSWGKDGNLQRVNEHGDFASVAWRTAGVRTWIAEFGVMDDRRRDAQTGWVATGLREESVIPALFEPYRKMRSAGHVGGITWGNTVGFFAQTWQDRKLKDNRWDSPTVAPEVREWWINEVTESNGYILGPAGSGVRTGNPPAE